MRERDIVLSLTTVQISERVVRGRDAFGVIRLRVELESLFELSQSLLRIAALEERTSLRERVLPTALWRGGIRRSWLGGRLRVKRKGRMQSSDDEDA